MVSVYFAEGAKHGFNMCITFLLPKYISGRSFYKGTTYYSHSVDRSRTIVCIARCGSAIVQKKIRKVHDGSQVSHYCSAINVS